MLTTRIVNVTEIPTGRLFVDEGVMYEKLSLGLTGGVLAKRVGSKMPDAWVRIEDTDTIEYNPCAEVYLLVSE